MLLILVGGRHFVGLTSQVFLHRKLVLPVHSKNGNLKQCNFANCCNNTSNNFKLRIAFFGKKASLSFIRFPCQSQSAIIILEPQNSKTLHLHEWACTKIPTHTHNQTDTNTINEYNASCSLGLTTILWAKYESQINKRAIDDRRRRCLCYHFLTLYFGMDDPIHSKLEWDWLDLSGVASPRLLRANFLAYESFLE